MEGYLDIQRNILYGYQTYYFILFKDNLIYCTHKGEPKQGVINLKVAKIEKCPKSPNHIIVHTGLQEYYIRAKSNQNRDAWFNALKNPEYSSQFVFEDEISHLENLYQDFAK